MQLMEKVGLTTIIPPVEGRVTGKCIALCSRRQVSKASPICMEKTSFALAPPYRRTPIYINTSKYIYINISSKPQQGQGLRVMYYNYTHPPSSKYPRIFKCYRFWSLLTPSSLRLVVQHLCPVHLLRPAHPLLPWSTPTQNPQKLRT